MDSINAKEGQTYTIVREKECQSSFFIQMTNEFGKQGGYEKLLAKI